MTKRRTNFLYLAALLIIMGIMGFLMPLLAQREVIVFRVLGEFGFIGKMVCLILGGVSLIIGFIRFFSGPKPEDKGKMEGPAGTNGPSDGRPS